MDESQDPDQLASDEDLGLHCFQEGARYFVKAICTVSL